MVLSCLPSPAPPDAANATPVDAPAAFGGAVYSFCYCLVEQGMSMYVHAADYLTDTYPPAVIQPKP